jgi:hypothetical protein
MKKIGHTIFPFVLCLFLWSPWVRAEIGKKDEITIVIPEKVIERLISDTLPVEITAVNKLSGTIWVQSIDKVSLGKNKIFFSAHLFGKDVKYTDKIGNISASIAIGNIDLFFDFDTTIRYDKEKQILYLKPKITSRADKDVVLTRLMETLTGDREYPVKIQKLKSFVTRVGKTHILIKMDISDVYTLKHQLIVEIKPKAVKTDKQQ